MANLPSPTRWIPTILLMAAMAGCNRPSEFPTVFPVKGQIQFEGVDCGGAVVVFHPVDGVPESQKAARARTDSHGVFRLSTFTRDDGAMAGDYAVVVEWKEATDHPENGADRLPVRYGDPKRTPLRASIKPQANELPTFRLTR